ncbi:MAG: DUF1926 domain-containing protein [Planctomycetaceae bacterium]|nr:DUF1926 domain-containing protein [Planctomycetaceae bacterium]
MTLGYKQRTCNTACSPIPHLFGRWQFLHDRLQRLHDDGHADPGLDQAKWHLYCAQYHGCSAVGAEPPMTLPSSGLAQAALENWCTELPMDAVQSIRRNLIDAENLIDKFRNLKPEVIEALLHDFDGDGETEIRLANSHCVAWMAPSLGGRLLGLDSRNERQNVLAGDLPSFVEYFWYPKIQSNEVSDYLTHADANFANGSYHGQLRQGEGRVQVLLRQQSLVHDLPLRVSKALTILESQEELEITYLIEGLPAGIHVNFGSLWHWTGIGTDDANRFLHDLSGHRLGSCRRSLYLPCSAGVGLCDAWSGIDLQLCTPKLCSIAVSATPIESRCSTAFHHVSVLPHWTVTGDLDGRWSTKFSLRLDSTNTSARKSPT